MMTTTAVRMRRSAAGAAVLAFMGVVGLFAAPTFAQDANRGVVTSIDLKACKIVKRHADGNAWMCKGLASTPVYVAEGDLRFFVSAGAGAEKRRAAQQTLKPFNTIFKAKASRASVEWRVKGQGKTPEPYATIIRYYTQREDARGEVLVVSKVSATESCHLAAIDALATANAMELARKIADEKAESFSCKDDPKVEGQTGKSPM